MTDPLATPAEVKIEINTNLSDEDIEAILGRVARDNDRVNDAESMDDALRTDLEAAMAAYHIATQRERATTRKSLGNASKTYDASIVDRLEDRVVRLDPSNGDVIKDRNEWTVTRSDVSHE